MDLESFADLPELSLAGKQTFSELHVSLRPEAPRPVAVRVRSGLKLLPRVLWEVAELAARAIQGAEITQPPACSLYKFLTLLLAQAVAGRGILTQPAAGESVLSLLLVRESKMVASLALPAPPVAFALQDKAPEAARPARKRVTKSCVKHQASLHEQLFVAEEKTDT